MKIKNIIIHHEQGYNGFLSVNEWHRQLWNFKSSLGYYIGYNYYIDRTGKVWHGRADGEETAHTKGRNWDSLGICLEGDFDYNRPTISQIHALRELLNKKMVEHAVPPTNIFPHRQYANKSCPGWRWGTTEIRALFQPSVSYIQSMINSIRDLLNRLQRKRLGSSRSCINEDSRG